MPDPQIITAEVAMGQRLELGESARWFGGALHWVDVPTGRRFRWEQGTEIDTVEYEDVVTAVFDAGDGRVGAVLRDAVVVPAGGRVRRTPLGIDEGRSNDARVDPHGGLWVGTWMPDVHARTARLMRVAGDEVTLLRDGLTMSNGIGFVGGWAFHADTFARVVNRYGLDGSGGISLTGTGDPTFLSVGEGLPDGLTVDADGGVWVALWGAGCARRFDATGRLTHEVRTPGASQVTSVALGGDGRDLFLTTAAEGVDEPNAGSLFRARADVVGVREYVFGTTGDVTREGAR